MNVLSSELPEESSPDETAGLVRKIQAGSPEVFDQLYQRVAASLYAWMRIRLCRMSAVHVQAEDVLQEVWVRALGAFSTFDLQRSSFRGWILGIAKNVLLEEHRRNRPSGSPAPSDGESVSQLERCPDTVTSIISRLARDEALQNFLEHVRELDPVDGMILLHVGFEDFNMAETATRVGLSPESVKKRWQRLRAKLCAGGIGYQLLLPPEDPGRA